jgi:hypothetical protein
MNVVTLAWYSSGMLALLCLLISAISVAPQAEQFVGWLFASTGIAAVVMAGVAIFLSSLPTDHWVRKSRPLSTALIVVATVVSLLVILIG